MTPAQLNRDIKRLAKNIQSHDKTDLDAYYKYIDGVASIEFRRLYNADSAFLPMNRTSILIMLSLNLTHRFMPLHQFGLMIDLNNLI